MSLVNLVARTATREELIELLRQHDIELVTTKLALEDAKGLLTSANKWVRMVEERREDVPHWFRHDADPKPLRQKIDVFLR